MATNKKRGKLGLTADEINTPLLQAFEFLCQTFGYEPDPWERRGYERTLAGINADVLTEAAQLLVDQAAAGRKFYPIPKAPDWKAACAKVRKVKEGALRTKALAECQHDSKGWREVVVNGITRMARCECWEAGEAAVSRLGAPLELPPVPFEETDRS